jgi:hypothetical protein
MSFICESVFVKAVPHKEVEKAPAVYAKIKKYNKTKRKAVKYTPENGHGFWLGSQSRPRFEDSRFSATSPDEGQYDCLRISSRGHSESAFRLL